MRVRAGNSSEIAVLMACGFPSSDRCSLSDYSVRQASAIIIHSHLLV